jgi:fructokinase
MVRTVRRRRKSDMSEKVYGGIEAGGTKFVCAAGTGPEDIRAEARFPTTSPEETIERAIEFFSEVMKEESLETVGIGSFGPLDLRPNSPTYGYITTSPKSGWENTDFAGRVHKELGIPIKIDTDVNAAALGEGKWGAAQGLDTFIYLTVGTGIGGGGVINGRPMGGLVHPEMGHILIKHDGNSGAFEGSCPYHGDCWEGLASGEAMERRWGMKAEDLPDGHLGWTLEVEYLAAGIANLIVTISPQRVITGGGIIKKNGLIEAVRVRVVELLNGYVTAPEITENIDQYIVLPGLGDRAGVLGAIVAGMGY